MIKINTKELKDAVGFVAKVSPGKKASHTILQFLKLEVVGDHLSITATDLTTFLSIDVPLAVSCNYLFKTAVKADLFKDLISKIGDEFVELDLKEKNIRLVTSSGSYQIQSLPAEEFPSLPEVSVLDFNLDCGVLESCLKKVLFCVSSDEIRQSISGVRMIVEDEKIELAATDGHRLSVKSVSDEANDQEIAVTLPSIARRLTP